ncbi:hypothetical protein KKB40_02825 [Patescibacteria group bacterium]|nr:hypothetical protein [Patescibacteria group bacterium]
MPYIIHRPPNWKILELDKMVTVKLDERAINILSDIKKWTREDFPNSPADSYDDALKSLESIAMFDSEMVIAAVFDFPYEGAVRVEGGIALDKPSKSPLKEVKLSQRALIPLRNLQKELRKRDEFFDTTLSGCIRYLATIADRRRK